MIPFLRTNDDEYYKILTKGKKHAFRASSLNQSGNNSNGFSSEHSPMKTQRPAKERALNFIRRRETAWE